MTRITIRSWMLAMSLAAGSCVDPYPIPPIDVSPRLVIDALISAKPGPHTVVLSYSSNPSNEFTNPVYALGATVQIIADAQDTISLTEIGNGRYETQPASWQPVSGKKYQLYVRLPGELAYVSDEQEIQPAGTIENMYFEYRANSINGSDPSQPQDAIWVYLNSRGTNGAPNLFRWRTQGVYEVVTSPELRTTFNGVSIVSDPPACAIGVCTCCNCWITEYERTVTVSNNDVNDIAFNGVLISIIPVDPFRFYSKYYVAVEQLSLTSSAYSFWSLVQAQQQGSSNVFQPNAIRIAGNVRSLTNPDEKVYGLVAFAGVTQSALFIYRSDIPTSVPPIPVVTDDCRLLRANASNQRPSFW